MAFYTGKLVLTLDNPTIVVLTDRNDLDDQLFGTFSRCHELLKGDRYPLLSERRNIIVIADEAHRSQYDFIDGVAKHMRDALPNASFIGFTGMPIEKLNLNEQENLLKPSERM